VGKSLGHYAENTGNDVLQFLEVFRAERYEEVSLAEWLGHVPPELVMRISILVGKTWRSCRKGVVASSRFNSTD